MEKQEGIIFTDMHHRWMRVALVHLIIAGFLGALMRYAFVGDLPEWIDYNHIKHAHSHVAMMGWLYSGLFIFIVFLFRLRRKVYKQLFWLTQLSVVGMMISFPVQGYKLVSIVFSTMHLFLSYAFIYYVFRDVRSEKRNFAVLFLKTSLVFLFVSSLGTWALAGLMNSPLRGSAVYYATIQFFLHFQFNGWFVFGLLALFFRFTRMYRIYFDAPLAWRFYYLLMVSCVLTYALAVTWSTPYLGIFITNSLGVLIQLAALYYFVRLVVGARAQILEVLQKWGVFLLTLSGVLFFVKIVIQALVAVPYLATISYTVKNFVIGFIHLLMLGVMTSFLLGMYYQHQGHERTYSAGLYVFIAGFVGSEILLFGQGVLLWARMGFVPGYYGALFFVSLLMPVGVLLYWGQLVLRAGKY